MTWLQRSLNVAARFLAPCSCTGFRRPALVCRISPSNWGLLPGAPALTRTDLSSARTTRLSGRTKVPVYRAWAQALRNARRRGVRHESDRFVDMQYTSLRSVKILRDLTVFAPSRSR